MLGADRGNDSTEARSLGWIRLIARSYRHFIFPKKAVPRIDHKSQVSQAFLRFKNRCENLHSPYTPQLDGVAESINRVLLTKTRALLGHANLDSKFWADAVNTAYYLRNINTKTHLTRWYGSITFHTSTYLQRLWSWTARGSAPAVGCVGRFGFSAKYSSRSLWQYYSL